MRVHRSIRGGGGAWLGACVGRCGGDEPGVQESLWVEVEEPGWPGEPGAASYRNRTGPGAGPGGPGGSGTGAFRRFKGKLLINTI
jgi:hypothetical protein